MLALGSGLTTATVTQTRQILPLKLIRPTTVIAPQTLIAGN